jgi:hypothetical protein
MGLGSESRDVGIGTIAIASKGLERLVGSIT